MSKSVTSKKGFNQEIVQILFGLLSSQFASFPCNWKGCLCSDLISFM